MPLLKPVTASWHRPATNVVQLPATSFCVPVVPTLLKSSTPLERVPPLLVVTITAGGERILATVETGKREDQLTRSKGGLLRESVAGESRSRSGIIGLDELQVGWSITQTSKVSEAELLSSCAVPLVLPVKTREDVVARFAGPAVPVGTAVVVEILSARGNGPGGIERECSNCAQGISARVSAGKREGKRS